MVYSKLRMQVCRYALHHTHYNIHLIILYTAQNKHRATDKLLSDQALGKEGHTCISTFCNCSCYYLIWNVGILILPHSI